MADFIDDAQAVNELHQEVSLANQRLKTLPESHPDFNGVDCVGCGDPIPPQRLSWGRIRCTGCQEWLEACVKAEAIRGRPDEG